MIALSEYGNFRHNLPLNGMALSSMKPLLSRYFFDCVGSTGGSNIL